MSRNTIFQASKDKSAFALIRSECESVIQKVQNEIDKKNAKLQALINSQKAAPVQESVQQSDETSYLIDAKKDFAEQEFLLNKIKNNTLNAQTHFGEVQQFLKEQNIVPKIGEKKSIYRGNNVSLLQAAKLIFI